MDISRSGVSLALTLHVYASGRIAMNLGEGKLMRSGKQISGRAMKRTLGVLATLALVSGLAVGLAVAQGAPPTMSAPPSQNQSQYNPNQPNLQQPNQQGDDQQGPPQSVARVSLLRGDVSTQRGDSGDWVAITLNTPVMAGDKVSTSPTGSAELQMDSQNMLRLSGHTEADITALMENHIQIQIASGLAQYAILKGSEADVEIDTPNVGIHPSRESSIRIQVNSANETVVIVRRGEAGISTSQGSTDVAAGQMITIRGGTDNAQYQTADAPALDEWDNWNIQRDGTIQSSPAWNHVDQTYTGANDLDKHGDWSEVPDYGQVWTPNNVDPDWAPYSDGNWVWEPYYGWTWVGNESWGWAPYHYGRWFRYGGAWRWWPGQRGIRPVWGPAYVSFFGFGGFGSIGWLAIGPCDPFFPWYGRGRFGFGFFGFNEFAAFRFGGDFHHRFPGAFEPLHGHFDERFSNFRQAERDPHILRSVNSERAGEFGHGAVAHTRGISSEEFHNSRFTSGGVPAVPTRESLSATNRAANPGTIRNNQNTRFFGSNSRQPSQRNTSNSFSEQAGRVQQGMRNSGLNVPTSDIRRSGTQPMRSGPGGTASGNMMRQQNNTDMNRGGAGGTQNGQPASRSFEGQGTDRPNNSGSQLSSPNSGGWHQFSGPANTPPPNRGEPGQPNRSGSVSTVNTGSRPPLDLRRPVVGGTQYNRPAPTRPTYNGNSAPSRPSYGGAPVPPSRPSGNSAPPPPRSSGSGSSGGGSHGGSSGGGSHGSSGGSRGSSGGHGSSGHR
jgi:hypothetical protein